MSDARPRPPASCAACVFHRGAVGDKENPSRCLRHAPGTGDTPFEVAAWPPVEPTDRCGAGAAVPRDDEDADDGPRVVSCGNCLHWHQPGGVPLQPRVLGRHGEQWWAESGLCTRWAPSPTSENDARRRTCWKTTNAYQGCGDGEAVAAAEDSEEDGLLLVTAG